MSEPTSTIEISAGRCFAVDGNDRDEVQNIFFKFDNGITVSIGVSSMHYCRPRDFQGLEPVRSAVEVAISDDSGTDFITNTFFNRLHGLDGSELYDDVLTVNVNQLPSILAYAERWGS